jgi:hypothetical protein
VELLILPEHEPIIGHDLSTLYQQERKQKSGNHDGSVSGEYVLIVDLPGHRASVPFLVLHDHFVLLVLFLEGSSRFKTAVVPMGLSGRVGITWTLALDRCGRAPIDT